MTTPAPGESVREGLRKLGFGGFTQTPEEAERHRARAERTWQQARQPVTATTFHPPHRLREPAEYEL